MDDGLIAVRLRLQGARQFAAEAAAGAGAIAGFGLASEEAAAKTHLANLETRAFQQGMYTLRRYAFWGTTAVLGFAAASLKLGLSFDETRASGMAAFTSLLGGASAANREMSTLVGLTHDTGVQLGELTSAAETMQGFGFSIRDVNSDLAVLANFAERSGRGSGGLTALVEVFDRIRQSGRLTSLDLRTLNTQGISGLQILTKQLGLTQAQALELQRGRLVVPSNLALPALAAGIGARANQLGTNLGQQTGIAHSFLSQILGGGESGIFSFATRGLEQVNKAFAVRVGGGSFLRTLDPSGKLLTDWRALVGIAVAVAGGFRLVWKFASPIVSLFTWLIGGTNDLLHKNILFSAVLHSLSGVLTTLVGLYLLDRVRLLAVVSAQKLATIATLGTTGAMEKQVLATKEANAETVGLRGSLLGLKGLSPLKLLILASLVPHAPPSHDPRAPSNNPVAKWFASIPGVGGLFSQANRAGDWVDQQLGLLPSTSAAMHQARLKPIPGGWSSHGLGGGPDANTTVIVNLDGDKIAEATVKTQGRRKVVANGVLQAQSAAAGRH